MEFLDGLVQRPGRIILQRAQKAAEALGRMVEVHRVRHAFDAHGIRNIVIAAPRASHRVLKIVVACFRLDIIQRLAVRVAAARQYLSAQVFRHAENILHDGARVLKHTRVDALDDIAQLVAALRRHVHGIGVVDVSRAEGLYIAGRLAQLESEQRVLQVVVLHPVNVPAGGIQHGGCLGARARLHVAPGLDGGVQIDVHAVFQDVIVVHQRAAVYKACRAQHSIGVDDGPVQHKAARPKHRGRADDGCGMHHAGHTVTRVQQATRPRQAQAVVAKRRHGLRVFTRERSVVHAFACNVRAADGVVQKRHAVPVPCGARHFPHHLAKAAGAQDQKFRHAVPPMVKMPRPVRARCRILSSSARARCCRP